MLAEEGSDEEYAGQEEPEEEDPKPDKEYSDYEASRQCKQKKQLWERGNCGKSMSKRSGKHFSPGTDRCFCRECDKCRSNRATQNPPLQDQGRYQRGTEDATAAGEKITRTLIGHAILIKEILCAKLVLYIRRTIRPIGGWMQTETSWSRRFVRKLPSLSPIENAISTGRPPERPWRKRLPDSQGAARSQSCIQNGARAYYLNYLQKREGEAGKRSAGNRIG
jgi:hypothetical protein